MITEVSMIYGHYTNFIGVMLCIIVAFGSKWRFKEKNRENIILVGLLVCAGIACVMDSIAVWADGRPGNFARTVVYASNTWLFMACVLSGMLWIGFMEEHIHGKNSTLHMGVLQTISAIGIIILGINLYIPIVFAVNGNNVYERRELFFLYIAIELSFLVDSIQMYMRAKYRHGGLSVFQIWLYIAPQIVGMFAQLFVYGTSLIWPSTAVATAVLFIQFNIDDKYRDNFTRLYKYEYIEVLCDKLTKFKNKKYMVILVQVLGIANVEGRYGKEAYQQAKLSIVKILKKITKPKGVIIQCENEAYVIILNSTDEAVTDRYISGLKYEINELNKIKKSEYSLTASYGYGVVDVENDNVEEIVQNIRKEI